MLAREPEEVAKFFAKTQGLNKTMIGEYLGEREETCLRVMHAYVDAMDFSGAAFDQAIRCSVHSTPCRHAMLAEHSTERAAISATALAISRRDKNSDYLPHCC